MASNRPPAGDKPTGKHSAEGTANRTGPGESPGKHRPENVPPKGDKKS